MRVNRFLVLASVCGFAAAIGWADVARPVAAAAVATPTTADRKTVEHDGEVFALAQSSANQHVETDEYTLTGETIGNWTQLLTVQRLALTPATDADAFVAYFQKQVVADGATLDVLVSGKMASVFAVRFPKSERNDEQVMVCLAMVDLKKSQQLDIVQYAIKPLRVPVAATTAHLKSWRDKFVAQAKAAPPH